MIVCVLLINVELLINALKRPGWTTIRELSRKISQIPSACLLHRKSKAKLPHSEEHESLANAFAVFFTDKITAIREELHLCRGGPAEPLVEVSYDGPKFECFKQVSCQELSNLLAKSSIKSCALDPIPATVLKGCLDLLLPFITKLVNCSLQCSVMTESMKQAQLRPLLKKPSLNHELFKNYLKLDVHFKIMRKGGCCTVERRCA